MNIADRILSGVAAVVNTIADKIPAIDVPWSELTEALAEWVAVFRLWMDTFPFLWTMVTVLGLMLGVHVAQIAWYWLNWLLKKIPFLG